VIGLCAAQNNLSHIATAIEPAAELRFAGDPNGGQVRVAAQVPEVEECGVTPRPGVSYPCRPRGIHWHPVRGIEIPTGSRRPPRWSAPCPGCHGEATCCGRPHLPTPRPMMSDRQRRAAASTPQGHQVPKPGGRWEWPGQRCPRGG